MKPFIKYVIRNTNSGFYFEQDFAGWSWQEKIAKAAKFKEKAKAQEYAGWLNSSDFPCQVEDYVE